MSEKKENKVLITKEDLIKENASKMPALEKAEKQIEKAATSANKIYKDLCIACATIKNSELYKARGYTSLKDYCNDNFLQGLSASTVSNYANVGNKFYLSEKPANKAIAEKCNYTVLAELVRNTDDAIEEFNTEFSDFASDEISATSARNFADTHAKEKDNGAPKVVKTYDYSGFACRICEGAIMYAIPTIYMSIDNDFYNALSINPDTVKKCNKIENGIKDAYMYTAITKDCDTMIVFNRIVHVTKAENNIKASKESRKQSFKEFLHSLPPEERAEYLASLDD